MQGDEGRWLYEIIRNESDFPLSMSPEGNPIPIPMNLSPQAVTATTVDLAWDAVGVADSYEINQSIDNGVTWTLVTVPNGGSPTTNMTTVTALTTATNYQFAVAAVVGSVTGEFSTPISVLTK